MPTKALTKKTKGKVKPGLKKKPVKKTTTRLLKIDQVELLRFNQDGKPEKPLFGDKQIFTAEINPSLLAQAVRVYQMNLRQGTQSTKTRGEVAGSTRKIFRQKGTGRARHGSIKAPIFVGGGIVFGPKPRNFDLHLTKPMRKKAMFGALSDKVKSNSMLVLSGLKSVSNKTKEMYKLLKKLKLEQKKLLLILEPNMQSAIQASRNLEHVILRPVNSVSTLDILKSEFVLFAEEAIATFQKHYIKKPVN